MVRYTFLILVPMLTFGKVHYAKVEPYESITLKSSVSAQVEDVKIELEGREIKKERPLYSWTTSWVKFS